jgi:hypothetical protein
MISLLVLVAAVGLTLAVYVWGRPTTRIEALAFIFLYCLSLGLSLRFGNRTYPGIYFPDSPFLNSLLNGNGLFTGIGYDAVLVAGVADALRVFTTSPGQRFEVRLNALKWVAVTLAVVIAIFGFWSALVMHRLP